MHALFLDGHDARDSEDTVVLGLAWGHRHIVMYKRTLQRSCSGVPLPGLQQRLCEMGELSVFIAWTTLRPSATRRDPCSAPRRSVALCGAALALALEPFDVLAHPLLLHPGQPARGQQILTRLDGLVSINDA
jgi:hypothetical protein